MEQDQQAENINDLRYTLAQVIEELFALGIQDDVVLGAMEGARAMVGIPIRWPHERREQHFKDAYSGALARRIFQEDFIQTARKGWITPPHTG